MHTLIRSIRPGALIQRLQRWQELRRQRRELLQLDDRMLSDLGISRADAWREARRPFWDDSPVL